MHEYSCAILCIAKHSSSVSYVCSGHSLLLSMCLRCQKQYLCGAVRFVVIEGGQEDPKNPSHLHHRRYPRRYDSPDRPMKLPRFLTALNECDSGSFNSALHQELSSSGREVGAATPLRAACGRGVKRVRRRQGYTVPTSCSRETTGRNGRYGHHFLRDLG